MSKCGVFSGPYFPVFSANAGKYGPEKTLYLGTFHAVKLFKKFKKSRLHIDKEFYKKSKYDSLKLITSKKQGFFEDKFSETIGKPKEL